MLDSRQVYRGAVKLCWRFGHWCPELHCNGALTPLRGTGALSWRTSSYSTSIGGDCVEVAAAPRTVAVRDSKDPQRPATARTPERPELASNRQGWRAFTRPVKAVTSD